MKLLPFSVQTFNTSLAVHVAAQSPAVSRGHDPWVHLMQPLQRVQHVISGLGKGEVSQFAEWNGASGLSSASCTDLQPTFSYTASTWHLWHPLSMMPYTSNSWKFLGSCCMNQLESSFPSLATFSSCWIYYYHHMVSNFQNPNTVLSSLFSLYIIVGFLFIFSF